MRISDWSSDVCSSDLIRALLVGRERTNDRFPQAEGRGPALSSRHPIVPNSSFPRVKAGCRLHETWTLSVIRYPTSTARETSHARRAVLDLVYCPPGCELLQVLDCSDRKSSRMNYSH